MRYNQPSAVTDDESASGDDLFGTSMLQFLAQRVQSRTIGARDEPQSSDDESISGSEHTSDEEELEVPGRDGSMTHRTQFEVDGDFEYVPPLRILHSCDICALVGWFRRYGVQMVVQALAFSTKFGTSV